MNDIPVTYITKHLGKRNQFFVCRRATIPYDRVLFLEKCSVHLIPLLRTIDPFLLVKCESHNLGKKLNRNCLEFSCCLIRILNISDVGLKLRKMESDEKHSIPPTPKRVKVTVYAVDFYTKRFKHK